MMRWSTYVSAADGREHVALSKDGALYALRDVSRLVDLLGEGFADRMADAAERAVRDPFEVVDEATARFRAPVPTPPSIRDFMAFEEHVRTSSRALGQEVNPIWYEIPLFYFTNPAATRGPNDDIPVAPGSQKFDYELEIAAVVGRAGADLDPAHAEARIAGYMVMCDWSARDLQESEMRGLLGPAKGKDTATSFSRYLVTPDELAPYREGNAYGLDMAAQVNGRPYSRGRFSTIYWSFGQLLAYASRGTSLRPGDVIGSGTVGTGCILELSRVHGEQAYPWLKEGDEVRLEVQHVGLIDARITIGPPVIPLRAADRPRPAVPRLPRPRRVPRRPAQRAGCRARQPRSPAPTSGRPCGSRAPPGTPRPPTGRSSGPPQAETVPAVAVRRRSSARALSGVDERPRLVGLNGLHGLGHQPTPSSAPPS
jgi:2-keto-4-pentenoate hydratase/2-oxohepta-3-ene-1,7-dioic acid hydratase in catechol pathway